MVLYSTRSLDLRGDRGGNKNKKKPKKDKPAKGIQRREGETVLQQSGQKGGGKWDRPAGGEAGGSDDK